MALPRRVTGLLAAAGLLFAQLLLTPVTGDISVRLSSRQADALSATDLALHSTTLGWQSLGRIPTTAVPKAPATRPVVEIRLPVGSYDQLRVGTQILPARVVVDRTILAVVLIAVDGGRPLQDGVYAGSQNVSVGLNELAGKLKPMPLFSLVDQFGRSFTNQSIAGHDVVLAAFHTTCQESCPLVTGLFLQLAQKLPPATLLIEATNDPAVDSPAVLKMYAGRIGASWTFLTGGDAALTAFWQPFGVELGNGDVHRSVLAVIDSHGYIRTYFMGAPDVGSSLPDPLQQQLNPAGRQLIVDHGDGWGQPQILDVLQALGGLVSPSSASQGRASDFSLKALDGKPLRLSDFSGRPVVINFWASYCAPCRREMPMLDGIAKSHPKMTLLLVDERDDAGAARRFAADLRLRSTVLFDGDGQVGDRYTISGLPTTVFVRADGSIEGRYVGETNEQILAPHLAAIGA